MRVVDTWHNKDRTRSARYGQGSRWMAVWSPAPGAEKKKLFKTKDAAKAYLEKVAADKALGFGHLPPDPTFTEYAEAWMSRQIHQRPNTRKNLESIIRRHLIPALENQTLRRIGRADVQILMNELSGRLAPTSVQLVYTYIAGIFREAMLDKVIRETPCVKINLPQDTKERIRPLSVEQVQKIAESIGPEYRAAVAFAAATGLRPGEWRGLSADRVDLDKGIVTVDRQVVGKWTATPVFGPPKTQNSYRRVKVGPATVKLLRPLVESPGPYGLVFTVGGRAINTARAAHAWRRLREGPMPEIGAGWHQLRHHHASLLIAESVSPVAVAHRLGHKDATETLRTYGHLWASDDDRMAGLADGLIV